MLTPTAKIVLETKNDGNPLNVTLAVLTTWNGPVQRKDGLGYSLATKSRVTPARWARANKLAERLARAINAGVVFTNPVTKLDVRGETYVSHDYAVSGKHLNSDLRRLGF